MQNVTYKQCNLFSLCNMIEFSAKLLGGSAYIPGENIICCVTFINKNESTEKPEILAWASAQVVCMCSTNSKAPVLTKGALTLDPSTSKATSLIPCKATDKGHVAFSTKPKILFCDLQLSSGASRSFMFKESLPPEVPPFYLGKLVKYTYKLTVGTQRVNCSIKLLRVPLRVLAVSGVPDYNACEDSEEVCPNNPFLEKRSKECDVPPALQLVQNITARRTPNYYNITNAKGKVGRFCLFKQNYRLGEDIVGTFDFSSSTIPCLQFTVTLQSEESITDEYKGCFKQNIAVISYNKHHEVCLHMKYCSIILPIPLHVAPAFKTDLVSLSWKLHFEFVIGDPGSTDLRLVDDIFQAPESVLIETMVWDLPIQLFPTSPSPEVSQNEYKTVV